MNDPTIVLGLDVGDRHTGVAIGNTITRTATPLPDLPSGCSLIKYLHQLQQQYNYSKIIIGLPITANGQYGNQAQKVKDLVAQLRTTLPTDIVLELEDERFTTQAAAKYLHKHPDHPATIDGVSAQFILESWLARESPS